MQSAVELQDVTVRLDGTLILDRISTRIPRDSVAAIIGPNGAGKTTLLRAMLGLIPFDGRIVWHSRRGNGPPRIGYVPQRLDFDRAASITVLDFLVLGRQRMPIWLGIRPAARVLALSALERVAVAHLAHRPLGKLSGGELQRVQLALALEHDPEILLLDEPVSGVDVAGERLFCDLIDQIHIESRLTVVLVSHELSVVSRHATHVLCLNRELQCAGPTPEVLTAENLSRIYGPHAGLYEHGELQAHAHAHGPHCSHGPDSPGAEPR